MTGADGKPLRVIETIAAGNYQKFGMFLLQDMNGVTVDLIEKDHISKGAENVTKEILKQWLTSDAPTRTYQHLIECLRQSELGALAELIAGTHLHSVFLIEPIAARRHAATNTALYIDGEVLSVCINRYPHHVYLT